jgi:hypothetical protein
MLNYDIFIRVNSNEFYNELDFGTEKFRRVWQKVIYQAFIDAVSRSTKKRLKNQKQRAMDWLNGQDESFYDVC